MKTTISIKEIMLIAFPLILGSLGHNLIAATDTLFLGRFGPTELAAIGLVAPLYLMVTMVSLAFSRGAQIMIARRVGERQHGEVGGIAQNLLYFELIIALGFFVLLKYFNKPILAQFVDSPELLQLCSDYLYYRINGVFFGTVGISYIALYSGVGRTNVIIYNTLVLAGVNVILNYLLIFGNFGFPKMGIEGAGLSSAIAEGAATLVFIVYMFMDKHSKDYKLLQLAPFNSVSIKRQLKLSTPIAFQSFLGLGSWFMFFSILENLGKEVLAISSAARVLFSFFGVPSWGLGTATNTIVSNLVGQGRKDEVFPTLNKMMFLSLGLTTVFSLILIIAPSFSFSIITDKVDLSQGAIPLTVMVYFILLLSAMYTIYFNGIVGVGAIKASLTIEAIAVVLYVGFVYSVVEYLNGGLLFAWSSEFVFAGFILITSFFYIRSKHWYRIKI